MNKQTIISVIIIATTIIGVVLLARWVDKQPGKYDDFAMCIQESGATFYGAFWCPHCQDQKRLFGRKSAELLPYVECSLPDGSGQTDTCADAEIEGYPTWEFADGERQGGVMTLADLAARTSCELTQ
jgi:thiol-disulfide isomerase/thioredoxin